MWAPAPAAIGLWFSERHDELSGGQSRGMREVCRGRKDRNGEGQEGCPGRQTVCADREGHPLDPRSDCAEGGGGPDASCEGAGSSSGWQGLGVGVQPAPVTGQLAEELEVVWLLLCHLSPPCWLPPSAM